MPHNFEFETTNQKTFKDFRFSKPEKSIYQKPVFSAVSNSAPKMHFKSLTRKDLTKHNYKQPAIDFIPYP